MLAKINANLKKFRILFTLLFARLDGLNLELDPLAPISCFISLSKVRPKPKQGRKMEAQLFIGAIIIILERLLRYRRNFINVQHENYLQFNEFHRDKLLRFLVSSILIFFCFICNCPRQELPGEMDIAFLVIFKMCATTATLVTLARALAITRRFGLEPDKVVTFVTGTVILWSVVQNYGSNS